MGSARSARQLRARWQAWRWTSALPPYLRPPGAWLRDSCGHAGKDGGSLERGGGGLRGRSGRAAAAGRGGGNGSGWGAVVGQGAYVVVTMSAGAGVNPRTGCWSSALDDTCRQATWHVGGDSGAVRHATHCGSSPSANRTRRAAPRGLSQGGLEGHRRSQRADQTEHGPQHVGLHVHACEVRGSSIDTTGPTDVHEASALVLTTG